MAKRHRDAEIVAKLRQIDVLVVTGPTEWSVSDVSLGRAFAPLASVLARRSLPALEADSLVTSADAPCCNVAASLRSRSLPPSKRRRFLRCAVRRAAFR